MRTKLLLGMAAGLVLAVAVTAIASAASFRVIKGNLVVTLGGDISPKAMPKRDYVPITSTIFGKIDTTDGAHPSALREAVVDVDKDVKINAKGLPACRGGQLAARDTRSAKKVCGATTVGSGVAHVEIAFPEQPPILVRSPITVFNGGESGGKVRLLIHVFITVPVPAAIVTQVIITRRGSGVHTVSRVPVAAGGAGSAVDFKFKLGRTFTHRGRRVGFFEARCPDGRFNVRSPKVVFKNEAKVPGAAPRTVIAGKVALPCRPKG